MGYKTTNGTYKETITFDGDINIVSESFDTNFYKTALYENIIIVNNESLTFDLSAYQIQREGVTLSSPIRIIVSFGDSITKKFVKPLKSTSDNNWNIISHKYNIIDPSYFTKNNEITITLINLEGYADILKLPFTLLQSSGASYGTDFELISANITNEKKISYVFNNKVNSQIIFVSN